MSAASATTVEAPTVEAPTVDAPTVDAPTVDAPTDPGVPQTDGVSGSILLATFDVPFDEAAATFAVDSAVELGCPLIVANVMALLPLPMSVVFGVDTLDYEPELAESLRAPAERARALGVRVERLRVRSFHRVDALIELTSERAVRLLVIGPDRTKVRKHLYNRAARAVRDRLNCLVWVTWDVPIG